LPQGERMAETVTTLYLMRHGEVDEEYHRKFGGTIDMELSPVGRHQALVLGQYVKRFSFDRLYASPMKRALATADPVGREQDLNADVVVGLREIDFGEWTGKTWTQVAEEYQINVFKWLDELEAGRVKGAELGADFRARVGAATDEIIAANEGGRVGVVCHGGVVRAMLAHLLEMPLAMWGKLDIEYASVSRVEVSVRKREVTLVNLAPWRELAD
jgi:broad specificity phosphatase PhoE